MGGSVGFEAAFPDEEVGVEVGEGFAELVEFFGGAVDFEACEVGEFEEFSEEFADVFEVGEDAGGADVGFAAGAAVAVAGEVVVEAAGFGGGFFDELGHEGEEGVEVSFADIEVGVEADGL